MLNKIMYKGDMFFPDLNGKALKSVDNVIGLFVSAKYEDGGLPYVQSSHIVDQVGGNSFRLYLVDTSTIDGNVRFKMFDLMSYIQNGGVLSRLLNHLYQCFSSLFRKWVRVW